MTFISVTAVQNYDCPLCGQTAGNKCRTPGGRKTSRPHGERCMLLTDQELAQAEIPIRFGIVDVPGGFNLTLNCTTCGLPISKTSQDFGMDCANDCARKDFEKPL